MSFEWSEFTPNHKVLWKSYLRDLKKIRTEAISFCTPEKLVSSTINHDLQLELYQFIKDTYDFAMHFETDFIPEYKEVNAKGKAPGNLTIADCDSEQIWRQLELRLEDIYPSLIKELVLAGKPKRTIPQTQGQEEELADGSGGENDAVDEEHVSDEDKEIDDTDSDRPRKKKTKTKRPKENSVVDDKFFRLSEMEEFLNKEDQKAEKEDKSDNESISESVDLFDPSDNEEEEEKLAHYKDFFEESEEETKTDGSNTEESDHENEFKSTFEKRTERLKDRISKLEDAALTEKPWQLKGEVTAEQRPENSLLEENLLFDHATRQKPVITAETTKTLEDLIRQRIKDQVWDDVEKKIKPTQNPYDYKKQLILDHEKSKLSLAEVYEKEYLKKQEDPNEDNDRGKEIPEHAQIEKMMKSLFAKLDALANFHYTPKAPVPEVRIVSNLPSIAMEEVAPVATSDATLLAPEEVKVRPRGDVIGESERTSTDRSRQLRQKKSRQRQKRVDKEKREKIVEKLNPGLGNKYSKESTIRQLEKASQEGTTVSMLSEKGRKGSVKSSTSFFRSLQDVSSLSSQPPKKVPRLDTTVKKLKL